VSGWGVLGVAVAGAAGAVLRAEATARGDATRATAVLNVVGAALLGATLVLLDGTARTVVAVGLLGATTTFSTWMVQAESHAQRVRVVLVPFVAGVAAVAAGRWLAMLVA
jgi:fluoride ion exporter CrcB/FEX